MKKSDEKRIAERYVKALFSVASDAVAVDAVEADLGKLGALVEQSADFRHFLMNPLLSYDAKAKTMLEILDRLSVQPLSRQFIGMLIGQKRLALLPEMITLFATFASVARGELRGELVAPAPLKPQEITAASERLGRIYGKKVQLQVREDSSLLGGVVVKIGSLELDGSLAGKMRRLKLALQTA